MSHATLLETLDTGALWSIARGLAPKVDDYKKHLAACDQTRRNDLDGRGHLSEESLAEFTRFFLTTCLDQVAFMEGLMQPERLRARILLWTEEQVRLGKLPPKSGAILEALLYRGELPRAAAAGIVAPANDRPVGWSRPCSNKACSSRLAAAPSAPGVPGDIGVTSKPGREQRII